MKAQMDAARARGVGWGMSEDPEGYGEGEPDVDNIDWRAYAGKHPLKTVAQAMLTICFICWVLKTALLLLVIYW